uniref:Phosphoglycerate mutase (2,3-diphosphoglycerate-dependent) n=1 Tax=Pyrodinium bahamense TaxID=73915 RepID=A0A7S0ARV7_9DINO
MAQVGSSCTQLVAPFRVSFTSQCDGLERMDGERQDKVVILIRHGQSNGNVRFGAFGKCLRALSRCRCPDCTTIGMCFDLFRVILCCDIKNMLRDPELSDVGKAQVASVARQFQDRDFVKSEGVTLVVHSDMRRTRATCEGLFASSDVQILGDRTFREWDLCETCVCGSDGNWDARVKACRHWIAARPEKRIAVVGHAMLFQAFQQRSGTRHFNNVEVRRCNFDVRTMRFDAGEVIFTPHLGPEDSELVGASD